jgi:hypothetical protein
MSAHMKLNSWLALNQSNKKFEGADDDTDDTVNNGSHGAHGEI